MQEVTRLAKVLIVDDREVNRYIRSQILRGAGFSTIEAPTGTSALEACEREHPDLVLLDIHLPDINGYEVCRRIKKDPALAGIMVMQVSASAVELKDALRGLDGGADDFLLEPVEPEYLVAKVRSLMRLRTAEERLRQSNEDLAQFAFVASHDLQEPLRTMTLFAQLLQRNFGPSLSPEAQEHIERIVTAGRRMSSLIHDLLEYSRISSSTDRDLSEVDLNLLVRHTRDWVLPRLQAAQGEMHIGELPIILGVEVRIAQVFRNLVENAIKYRRPDVPLRIGITATLRSPSEWKIDVADNGKGFEAQYNEEIFGIFRRLEGKNVEGTGIGLAICRNVVESAGGKIWATGEPGQGATFSFTWPVYHRDELSRPV